ncbi:MAG TPA: rod shape-determining protein MreC [Anaerolineae bacterium]
MQTLSSRSLVFYILAAISLVLLVLSSTGQLKPVEGTLGRTTQPFLVASNSVGRWFSNITGTARDFSTLRSQNQRLQTLVDTLTIDNLRLTEVEGENERLRKLLRFQQLNPTYDFRGGQVIARVTSEGPSNYLHTISIDLGEEHGIKPGMPVVTERGLVGRIYKVGPNTSTVLLITDPSSGVDALIQRDSSRAVGVVDGQAGSDPVMQYIPQDADVVDGDLVITSGLGGAFPKDLIIGQIVQVRKRDFEMFQQAVVRPTVNFDRLEVVLVITNFKSLPGQPDQPQSVG